VPVCMSHPAASVGSCLKEVAQVCKVAVSQQLLATAEVLRARIRDASTCQDGDDGNNVTEAECNGTAMLQAAIGWPQHNTAGLLGLRAPLGP
jgi:hypothetical protein